VLDKVATAVVAIHWSPFRVPYPLGHVKVPVIMFVGAGILVVGEV